MTLISWCQDVAKLLPWLQSNKKVEDFRKVLTKITKERKESFNVLWADPKTSPQASHLYPIVHMRQQASLVRKTHHNLVYDALFKEDCLSEDDV